MKTPKTAFLEAFSKHVFYFKNSFFHFQDFFLMKIEQLHKAVKEMNVNTFDEGGREVNGQKKKWERIYTNTEGQNDREII